VFGGKTIHRIVFWPASLSSRPQVTPKKNRSEMMRPLKVVAESPSFVICSCQARRSSGVAVSGDRPRKAANSFTLRMCALWVASARPRMCMSSIIRWRSGVVFSSLMETSCLTVGKTPIVSPDRPHT
jgi:hypothetical protein